jgi:hypothetical protein
VGHAGNLFRACHHLNVPYPNTMTREEVMQNENECIQRLESLKESAPRLRDKHLRLRLDEARTRDDSKAVKAIRAPLGARAYP